MTEVEKIVFALKVAETGSTGELTTEGDPVVISGPQAVTEYNALGPWQQHIDNLYQWLSMGGTRPVQAMTWNAAQRNAVINEVQHYLLGGYNPFEIAQIHHRGFEGYLHDPTDQNYASRFAIAYGSLT